MKSFRVGLTGGIASGKSTIAEEFHDLGIPVIDTDIIAREVVSPGQPALEEIRKRFGKSIIDANDQLDRAELRKIIFTNDDSRRDLEAIIHPKISSETKRQANVAGGTYQIVVVPLLVESELLDFVDRVLVIDCSRKNQIKRLVERDDESVAQAKRIISAQTSREDRLEIADDVIRNNGNVDEIRAQVRELDQKYRYLASHTCRP